MKSGRFYNTIFAMGLCAFAYFAQGSACLAQDNIGALTEENIISFIESTTDITTGNSGELSSEKITAYLDKHLDKKARFKSVMKYHIPGMPPQEAALSLDKEGFMQSVSEGAKTTQSYENLIEIKEVKVSSNGKKAFVKTQSTEYATMPVPVADGSTENVPMEGVSDCTQIISLHRGIIQMYSANCVTNIQFLDH